MKITRTIYKNVLNEIENLCQDQIKELTYGGIFFSCEEEKCNSDDWNCKNGYWVTITLPLTEEGDSEEILLEFDGAYQYFKFKENLSL